MPLRPIARMGGCKGSPGIAKKQRHDPGAEFDMCFSIGSVHVALRKIPNVMQTEAGPQSCIPGEPIEFPPGDGEKPRMKNCTMCPVQNGFRSNVHDVPPAGRAPLVRSPNPRSQ